MKIKHLWMKLGVTLLTVGILMLTFCFTQCKINVNAMTAADWQQAHIAGIGVKTQAAIIKSGHASNVSDLATVKGIGKKKAAVLGRNFCTYDTCRFEIFIIVLSIGTGIAVAGALLIAYVLTRRQILAGNLKSAVKKLSQK